LPENCFFRLQNRKRKEQSRKKMDEVVGIKKQEIEERGERKNLII
jgi:hypothetical protein